MDIKQQLEDFLFKMVFATIPIVLLFGLFTAATTGLSAPSVDVENELDRTETILQDIETNLPENVPPQVLGQLGVARDMQNDGRSSFENGEQMLALHMTMQAREIARRAEATISQITSQDTYIPEALLRLLEGNAEFIEELSPAMDELGTEVTRANFTAAVDMQNEAWSAFDNGDFEVAGKLAETAQNKLYQIKKAVAAEENRFDPEHVAAKLEQALELLGRAEEKIPEGAAEAMRLLNTSKEIYSESEALLMQGRSQEAVRMLEEVVSLTQRAVRLSEKRGLRSAELVETLSRTDDYLQSTQQVAEESGRGDAINILERADDMQQQAKLALNTADNAQAEKLTLEARRLAELAMRTAQEKEGINIEEVEKAVIHTDDLIADLNPQIEESGQSAAIDLIRRAEQLQAEAIAHMDRGRFKEALTTTRAAAETVRRAEKLAGLQ